MTKILYRATSADGLPKANYVEAETESEALAKLKAEGLGDIVLYEPALLARLIKERDKLDSAVALKMAASEIEMHENPCWKTLIGMFWGNFKGSLLITVVFAALAMWFEVWWPLIVAVMPLLLGGWLFWQYCAIMKMVRLAEAFALGNWDRVQEIGKRLRKVKALQRTPTGVIDVEFKLAYAEIAKAGAAAEEHLPEVLRRFEGLRNKISAPGFYENLLAMIYHKAGDYPAYVEFMRRANEVHRGSPMLLADSAIAEARFGSAATAAGLLEEIDPETLPWAVRMLYPYIAGVIALRENRNDEALVHLQAAVSGFLACGKNPNTWAAFALSAGTCALALARSGQNEAAKSLALSVWPMLDAHGDNPLLMMVKREVMA